MEALYLDCGVRKPQLKRDPLGSVTMHRLFAPILILSVSPGVALAQEVLRLDPSIAYVATGGSWSAESNSGQYRVIVRSGGFEHVVSELFVQWLRDPRSSDDSAMVVRAIEVESLSGIWSLGQPVFVCTDKCHVEIAGTDSHTGEKGNWVLTLGPPGQVAVRPK
jgi:hypothetical protein